MVDCEYQIGGQGKFYSESEFKKLLSEGYLDKVMLEKQIKIRGIKADEAIASSFQLPSAIQPTVTETKTEEVVTPTETVTKTEEKVTEPTVERSPIEIQQGRVESAQSLLDEAKTKSAKKKAMTDLVTEQGRLAEMKAIEKVNKAREEQESQAEPTAEEQDKVAEKASITPKNFRDLYKVNRELFGLDRVKSFANAIAMDRMIGTMARRAGVDKSEMYSKLQFEKSTEKDLPKGVKLQVDAWHGSPYQFDKFTTEKMGTGEGAQAFGWGLYFTDLKGIAENYAKNLSLPKFDDFIDKFKKVSDYSKLNNTAINNIIDFSENYDYDYDKVLDALKRNDYEGDMEDAINFLENNKNLYEKRSKNLYKVSLHKGKTPEQYSWLEWDKKLSNTTKQKIKNGINNKNLKDKINSLNADFNEKYSQIKDKISDKRALNFLIENFEKSKSYDKISSELSESDMSIIKDLHENFKESKKINNLLDFDYQLNNFDGNNIYSQLSSILGGSKEASLFLLENGIDGIKYPAESISRGATSDTARGFNYVVFDENAVSIEEAIKFQKDANKARGAAMVAMDGKAIIYALTDPNVSTPLHELAHVYEHYLTDAERNKILKAAGTDTWNTKTSEYFARGFEKYLAEGKSPVESLNKVFDKFKGWLTDIYSGIKGSEIDIKLNKEMKSIYDSMLKEETTKQPTKEAQVAKSLADALRKAKMNLPKGTAMASFAPGFDEIWDATIETVAKAIEVGGVTAGNFRQSINDGMKALRNTDAYKAITDPKVKAKISSQYRKALIDLVPQHFGFNADNLRAAEFDTFNEELEASKEKEKFAGGLSTKELSDLKAKAKKFVNDNLPVDNYRKTEVKSYVAKNFDKAKNVADIQKNLEAVNALLEGKEAKIAEKSREQLIKDINDKVKANSKDVISTNKRTGRKTAKISISAQEQLEDLHKQGVFNNLEALSQTELADINNNIDAILEKGKADKKLQNALEDLKKRTDQAMVLEELAGKPQTLSGEQEILDKLTEESGVVIVNGQSMNKSRFETFMKNNPNADLSDVKFYPNEQSRVKNLRSKTQGPVRKAVVSVVQSIRDLETAVKLLGKGSPRMKKWLEEEIMKPIREGQNRKQDFISKTIKDYNKKTDKIFGTLSGISKAKYILNNSSGITTGETSLKGREADTLTNAQVIHYYGLINNQDSSLTELSENKKKNIETLKRYNNVSAKEINDYMNDPKNKKLLDYYNSLSEIYNGDLADVFIPVIEDMFGIKIEKGNYWPEPKSGGATDVASLLDLESGNTKNISAIAPQMKHNNNAATTFESVSAHDMFHRYVESMAHAKEFLPVTKSVYSLLSKNNIPHIINKFNDINKYNSFLTDLGIVLTDKSPFQNDFTSSLANINALTTLMLRLKSVPQQVTAALHYYHAGIKDGVYPHDILAATLPVNKEEIKFIKDLFIDNTYLWTRMSGGMSNQETQALKVGIDKFIESYVSKKGSNVNEFISDLTKLATNSGMSFIKLGDFISITAPGGGGSFALAQFRKNRAEGNDYESSRTEAMQRWFEETERTQQPSIARETLSNVTYSSVYRTLFPFMSANNAMVKKINKGLIDISDWKNLNNNERAQAISDVIYYTLFAGIPFALVSSGGLLAWMRYNEEDDDEANAKKDRILFDAFADGIQGNMNTLGLAGKIASMAANTLRGKEFFNNVPLFERMAHTANIFVGLYNVEGDISKLDKQELNDFWKGWEPTEFEMRKMKKMTPSEREQYLKDNPFVVKKFYKEVGEEYKKLSAFQKMGANSKKSLEKVLGTKNYNELIEGASAYIEGNADLNELLFGMKTRDKDFYFKNKDQDKIFEGMFGEKYKEEEKKSRGGSSSRPGSFPKPKFGPKIPKF